MKFTRQKLLLIVAACAFIGLLCVAYVGLTHVERGENVSSVDWLPQAASNVSYYKSYSFTSYEFDIPESDFVKWSRWEPSPITDPVSVMRYCYSDVDVPAPGPKANDDDWRAFDRANASRSAIIRNGLYYRYVQSNYGGVCVAYDRNEGRAYFHSSPR